MKRIVLIACLLVVTSSASAAWRDLKEGLDRKTAQQLVGAPLFGNQSRGGSFVNWVYDNGGYIIFENGRVRYWQQPSGQVGGAVIGLSATSAASAKPGASHAGKSAGATPTVGQTGPDGMALRW